MRIFITGATGFVGRALTLRLLRDGHQLVAWVRSEARARQLLGAQIELARASDDDDALTRALSGCDAVVHLGNIPNLNMGPAQQVVLGHNTTINANVFRAASELGVKVQSLGPVRASLIKKGMVYSPAHGEMAFTVPLFDEFMVRAMPDYPQRP